MDSYTVQLVSKFHYTRCSIQARSRLYEHVFEDDVSESLRAILNKLQKKWINRPSTPFSFYTIYVATVNMIFHLDALEKGECVVKSDATRGLKWEIKTQNGREGQAHCGTKTSPRTWFVCAAAVAAATRPQLQICPHLSTFMVKQA